MIAIEPALLKPFASKYIWWKTPDEAVELPQRVIAQVMNIGDYTDVQLLSGLVGDDVLRDVIVHAEAGQFNDRSWSYWHYRLGADTWAVANLVKSISPELQAQYAQRHIDPRAEK